MRDRTTMPIGGDAKGPTPVVLSRSSGRDERSARLAGSDLPWSDPTSHHNGQLSRPADNVRLAATEPRDVLAGALSEPAIVVDVKSAMKLVPITSGVVIERGGNGEDNGKCVGRRPRWIRGCRDRSARMERELARTRALEEKPGRAVQDVRQVLERQPASLCGWGIEPSATPEQAEAVAFSQGEGQAGSQVDPGLGDGQRDLCTSSRSYPLRGRATVQRSERAPVAALSTFSTPTARCPQTDWTAPRMPIGALSQRRLGVPRCEPSVRRQASGIGTGVLVSRRFGHAPDGPLRQPRVSSDASCQSESRSRSDF